MALALVVVVGLGIGAYFAFRGSSSPPAPTSPDFALLQPLSTTFTSPLQGWVLGTAPCASAGQCAVMLKTVDAGRSWNVAPLPGDLLASADKALDGKPLALTVASGLNVRFANALDGWIYGSLAVPSVQSGVVSDVSSAPTLWSTHDGGILWHRQPLGWVSRYGAVFDVEAASGVVHLIAPNKGFGISVESSPVGEDAWRLSHSVQMGDPAGGGMQTGALVLEGPSGWLVEGNDRGTTGSAHLSRNGTWVRWTPPCYSVGHSFAIPAASGPRDLVAECTMGGFAFPLSRSAPPGATLGSSWLYFSHNGGASFIAGPELRPMRSFYSGIIASPLPGVIFLGKSVGNSEDLVASFDGGVRWTNVYREQPTYLEFPSSSHGVGIVISPSNETSLIMTIDGGRHWSQVTF